MPGSRHVVSISRLPWFLCAATLVTLTLGLSLTASEEDPLAEAIRLVELGTTYVEIGTDTANEKKVEQGVACYRKARALYLAALTPGDLTASQRNRIKAHLADVESRIEWYADDRAQDGGGRGAAEVRVPEPKKGEPLGSWCRRVQGLYAETVDPDGQAALARGLASHAGVVALPTLLRLFEQTDDPKARVGVHDALAMIGTSRIAAKMASFARKNAERHWDHALAVIYLCLEKSEASEPEKPFVRAIRAFHKLKNRVLTLRILKALDAMTPAGTAALGEVIYVPDFGYHDHTIELLAGKRDRRAVPPLLYKLNRFKSESRVQLAAHKALIQLGWYAVPELLARWSDKAAGTWISWTLRKITGETMGADKRKWHDWWKSERVRHPELFEDPKERPDGGKPSDVTGGGG